MAGDGARVPPSTCPTVGNHLAQHSLAMLSGAMGMVAPAAAGAGALIEERGRSRWQAPEWTAIAGKAAVMRPSLLGGVFGRWSEEGRSL